MFDPYHKWLGILPKDQPPNHYRLLGLEPYEGDLDVIEGAADRGMGFIRQYQSGEHAALAAKLLNEIATARLCLLKPKSKAEYDAKLQAALKAKEVDRGNADSFSFDAELPAMQRAPRQSSELKRKSKSKSAKTSQLPMIAGGMGAGILISLVIFFLTRGGQPPQKVEPVQREIVETKPTSPSRVAERSTATSELVAPAKTMPPAKPPSPVKSPLPQQVDPLVDAVGPAVDLIQAVDLVRDTFTGNWKREGTSLIGGSNGRLYLPASVPDDYQLKFRVKRVEGKDTLIIGFVMEGRIGMVAFDAYGGLNCGLYVDGRQPNVNCTTRHGILFENDRSSTIVLNVHPGHFTAVVDDRTVIDWYGDPRRLYCQSDHAVPYRESPFLVVARASYQFESAELIPIKPESVPERVNRLESWVDIMPLLDPKRDGSGGDWVLKQNVLSTPRSGIAKYSLPVSVPEEYTLSVMVEFPLESGPDSTFVVGLVAGGVSCSVVPINKECVGLEMIDGRRWLENETRLPGSFVPQGKSAAISCTVTKRGIRMDCDGRTLVNWSGDFQRLSPQPEWAPTDERTPYIGSAGYFKVSQIKIGPPTEPPRPLAPIESGKPTDLLALIDPNLDAVSGNWTKEGAVLRALGDVQIPKLVVPCEVPAEYVLRMRVARETGGKLDNYDLALNLPVGDFTEQVFLDSHSATISGIYLDRLPLNDPKNESSRRLRAIPSSGVQELVFTVRKTGLKVMNGNQTVIDWSGNASRASIHSDWVTPSGRIAIISWHGRFRFEKLEITPIESSSFPPVGSLGDDGNLLKIINPLRDSRQGEWKSNPDGLVCPSLSASRLCIPTSVPDRYELNATVERKSGGTELFVGLFVGGKPCAAAIDGGKSNIAGLVNLDGTTFYDVGNLTYRQYPGPLLPTGKPVRIRCIVLPDTVVVICGNKELIRWHGDSRRFVQINEYLPQNFSTHDSEHLWLGGWNSEFLFRELSLRSLGEDEAERVLDGFSGVFPISPQANVPLSDTVIPAATAVSPAKAGAAVEPKAIGNPVNLLTLIDAKRDTLNGTWIKDGDVLRVMGSTAVSKLVIPADVPAEYKLSIRLVREPGGGANNECLTLRLPVDAFMADVFLDAFVSSISGIDVDQVAVDNLKNVSARRLQAILPDAVQQLDVTVRKNGVKVKNGNRTIIDWTGSPKRLWTQSDWVTPPGRIAIGSYHGRFRFEELKLTEIEPVTASSQTIPDSVSDLMSIIDPARDDQVTAVPPEEIASKCLTWKGRKYFISELPVTFLKAQELASQWHGRLLTISSRDEERFLHDQGKGRYLWTAMWRRAGTKDWHDERDRPLKFIPTWAPGQPNLGTHELLTVFQTSDNPRNRGLHDASVTDQWYACIEWGNEIPGKTNLQPK